ncbi:RNA polymerase subunit sigma-70 [Streptomyces sp. V2]|uniref:sigma-70 family RNA polymerase sigma factor n=1 Tax=Streptomyces sp. V2 TaxID=1424099 RepID=UPI000D669D7A|nr:sigma-70 family RNA polymerase sigma factor [Streptomyces sp. V2]PWG12102.1 RNA polymerase subunit sigma-70 [Streptomyces sp. V2]
MDERDATAARFEAHRGHLRAVAFRMLGSLGDAEDAVQEAWLRLDRSAPHEVNDLRAWLTRVVGRICLDMLRSRTARREVPTDRAVAETVTDDRAPDPEQEAILVESVGRALLVVLDRLTPAERVAFVLHDLFAVKFDDIAPIVDRTPAAAKKLASRARLRVHGATPPENDGVGLAEHRRVVESFLAAARGRDLAGLLAVLDPDAVRRADALALPAGVPLEVRGARAIVEETLLLTRNALAADVVLVDGRIGLAVAPHGRLRLVLTFVVRDGRIAEYQVTGDPDQLERLDLTLPPCLRPDDDRSRHAGRGRRTREPVQYARSH